MLHRSQHIIAEMYYRLILIYVLTYPLSIGIDTRFDLLSFHHISFTINHQIINIHQVSDPQATPGHFNTTELT